MLKEKETIKNIKIMIHNKFRYLLTLVALFAMTAGAWADEQSETFTTSSGSQLTFTGEHFTIEGVAIDIDGLYICGGFSQTVTISALNGENITKIEAVVSYLQTWGSNTVVSTPGTVSGNYTVGQTITISNINATTVTLSSSSTNNGLLQVKNWTVYYGDAPDVVVTTNAAEAGAAFTEATFAMPAFDATVDYELVRDMAISMPVTVGTGNDGFRIRIKKDNQTGKFVPAEMTPQAMAGLITVTDDIEEKTLTNVTDYTVSIFAVDDNDLPTGDAITFADLTPGRYVAIATAAQGTIYDGQTPASNIFVLFEGYEVTIPAGEYITYYRDEALYVDATEQPFAQLYTITQVGETTATATEIAVSKANMPILVKNNDTQTQTILLIPTTDRTPDAVTAATQFVGTLEATTIAASTSEQNNYAFNGKQFVWVKTALAVGANKAWLEVPTGTQSAPILTLVFDNTTMIKGTDYTDYTDGVFYDLNGRKLQGKPTKKGVYIMNGKKVVVK
jgi:hypothetical protein